MDVRSSFHSNLALVLAAILFLDPIVATASQLAVDNSAGGKTSLGHAANGVPLINIDTANGNGLSHNRFQHYNVDPQGLILNNATGRTQATELGGIILGNPNLQGQAARIILNEVTGSNPSHLRGYTEVAGQAARVIVANPHGITCNGCGFINTPRATLSTGRPLIEQGRLSRFDVDGGQIDIEGAGLNASNIEQFELITRSARLNAELHARQLTVITGRNEVDAETLAATAKAADGKHRPSIAIDSSALGGMYAGAIRLVGTEAGVGVKLAGDLAASAGDISIDAAGKLTLARTISSGDLRLNGQDIELQGQAYAAKAVEITARDQMKIDQGLAAAGDIRLKAEHLSNAGIVEAGVKPDNGRVDANLSVETRQLRNAGTLLANRQLHVQASEHLNNQGGTLSGRALAEVTAARVDNRQGRVLAEQNLHLKSEVLDNSAGLLQSQGAANITARQALDNRNGSIGSAGQLKLVGGAIDNRDTGLISSGELLDADVASLDNRNGEVSAKRGLTLKADSVKVADKGLISSASNLALDAGHVEIGQQGEVSAVADMTLRARQWQQHGGHLLGRADISLDLRGGSLDNRGGLIAAQGQLALGNLASLDNRAGRLSAQKRVVIDAGQVDNRDRGLIGSAGSLLLEARRLDSSNQGEVSAGDELHLKLEQLVQHHGRLLAQGALRAEIAGQVDNRGGTLHGKQGVHLTAGDIDNRARGLINSDGLLVLAANRLDSSDQGEVSARGDLRMRLSHLIQQQGRLVSERRLRIDLGQGALDNRAGAIHARQGLELLAGRIDNRDKGLINSAGTLALVASSLDSSRGGELSAAADMALQLSQLTQQDGRLIGAGNVSLDLQGGVLDNQAGLLKAGKQLQLRQIGTLTNAGGEVSSSGDLAVSGAHLNNADGGRVIAAGQLALDLDTLDNAREGLLSGWAGVRIKAASLDNRDQGTVSSRDGELELTLQTLDNSRAGALVSKGTQRIRSDSLNNSDKGVISSEDDIELHVAGTLDNARQGTINASHLRLQVDQTLNQGGLIRARASLQLVGTSLDNSAGSLGAAGALNARLSGVLRNNQAGEFSSGGPLLLKLGSLDNRHGQIASQGLLQLFARAVENGAGTLAAEGDLELSLKGNLANQSGGLIYSRQGTLAIRAASLNNDSGTLQASKQLTGSIEQSISNSGGRLLSESGDLELSASHLRNGNDGLLAATLGSIRLVLGKLFDNSGGVTQANQDVAVSTSDEGRVRNVGGHLSALTGNTNIQTAEFVNQRGGLYAGRHLQVLASTFSNQGDSAGQGGKVSARIIDFSLRDALNNTHGLIEAGDRFHIGATTVDNRQGALRALGRSGESQLISTGVLDNRDGLVEVANGDFKLTPHSLLNAKGSIVHLGSGSFGLASSTLVRAGGTMFTNGALDIEAASWEHSGVVQARELSLRVASFRQSADGRLLATRRLSATGTDWHNDGLIASDGSLDLTLDGGYGGSGRLASQGDLTIKVASLDLARTASVVGGSLSRVTVTGHAVNRGQLLSSGDFTLRAAVLQNQGTLGSSQRLAIHAPQLRNERGLIFSGSDMLLRSHEVSNQRGNFYSLGELELAADDRAARASRFENDSGSVESAGDMRILADTIFNRRADFTTEKSLVSGTFNVYWDDHCKGKGCELYFRSVENYEDRISGDQDSPTAFITAGGHLNLHASRVDNLYSVISAGRDITVTADSLRNVGMAGGEQRHYNAGLYTRDRTIYRNFINSKNQFNRYNDPGSEHYRPGEIRVADVRATAPPGAYFSETSYSVPTSGAVVAPAIIQAGGVVNITATERIENSAVRERVVDAGRIGTQRTDVETTGSATSRAITAQLPPELAQRQVDPLRLPGFSLPSELDSLFRLNSRGSQEAYQPAPQLTSRPSDNRQLDTPEPGSSVGNTPQVQQVQRVTEVPAGHKSPNAHRYLVETNPALTQLKTFLSSDYLLSQLGYDPALAQKRLGDGLYEQHLIRQAVVERTGHRYLAGRHSDEAMFRHLMDNAIASRNRLGLSLGVALTAEQVAALTHDLVWLEEREVQGERVLVPVLYLAQAQGRLVANGALVQGSDLNLISGNALENIGTLRASGNLNARADNVLNSGLMEAGERLRLLATDSIRNTQGGIISGRDVGLTALKGDVINERSVTTVRVAGGGDRLRDDLANNEARIESSGKLSLRAGRDIRNTGSTLLAGGDAQLRAGRNLLIASQAEVDTYEYRRKREHGYDNRVTQHTATVEVGGNLNLDARQDVGVIASKIKTAGDMNLNAGRDLAITSAANEQHRYSHHKQGDSKTTRQNDEVRQQRSQLEAGGDARLSAEGDLLMVASELRAGKDAYLAAGKDIALLAANDETYVLYQKQSKSRFARNSFQRDEATQVRAQGTSVKAEGDVAITSKGDQTYQAAQLQSGQDLTLESGGQIVFEAVKDLDQQSREKSKGNLAWQSAKGRGQTDETLRQSQLAAQGEIAIKAVQGLRIDLRQVDAQTVRQSIDAMVEADPRLAWIKVAEQRGDVDWRQVKEIHDSFKYRNSGLGPGASLVVAITTVALVGPAAKAALGTLGGAFATSQVTTATVGLINNKGDLSAALKEAFSSDSLKSAAVAAVTAGLTENLYDGMLKTKTNTINDKVIVDLSTVEGVGRFAGNQVLQGATSTALNRALGRDVQLKDALTDALLNTLAAASFNLVGDFAQGKFTDGSPQKVALHALVGGLLSATTGGDFVTGALAAGANEALVDRLNTLVKNNEVLLTMASQLVGVTTAALLDGDMENAAWVNRNATQYNYLNHAEAEERLQKHQACEGGDRQACNRRDELDRLRDERNVALKSACNSGPTSTLCQNLRAQALAARDSFEPHRNSEAWRAAHNKLIEDDPEGYLKYSLHQEQRSITEVLAQTPETTPRAQAVARLITDFTPAGTAQALVEAEDPVDVAIALASSNPISKGTLEILKKARGLYKQGKVKEADELLAQTSKRVQKAAGGALETTSPVAIRGKRAIDKAQSYERGVRDIYGSVPHTERKYTTIINGKRVNGVADNVIVVGGKRTAVEAKFVEDWGSSIRNPASTLGSKPWSVVEQGKMLEQAKKYSSGFEGGVVYHTNSPELAVLYSEMFKKAGITNFKFLITPVMN